jgi:hypothetical protein
MKKQGSIRADQLGDQAGRIVFGNIEFADHNVEVLLAQQCHPFSDARDPALTAELL